jgi:signal transduction histidine kinase
MDSELKQALHAKDEFLAIVSHELRTPLTAMLGWVQLLNTIIKSDDEIGKRCNPVLIEGFRQIELSCLTQSQLINDLLDMSKVTLGQFSVRLRPVELQPIVEETIASIRPNFEAKQIALVYTGESVGFVGGDPIRLRQVIWNLLYNALKFTDKGAVYVTLDSHRRYARIVIRDTGRGIPIESLPTIFEKLNKASGAPSSHGGGLGLGLSLTKTIVDLHAGHLYAESEGEGQGAAFTVVIPQA